MISYRLFVIVISFKGLFCHNDRPKMPLVFSAAQSADVALGLHQSCQILKIFLALQEDVGCLLTTRD
jgi:hypothetical protein